ncbi:YebG family protein [Marinimicrobium sp. ABcell2]|uniref:YebG family protein n=1 Tax=Marinimicrobium sp. ABcell2 TaxID=3069751 RepID=UPI0027B34AC7|nr:YebG family protein [Marinimicrobium sp. ABcell2]MDQ2078148.1 YebG family protein [Marinimicrobium sp. ABcell2]
MAVIAVWQCDRDGSMFEDKKQAEEHDKYLELAANITQLIESEVEGLSEGHSEAIGLLLAKRREILSKACKGKPELLLEPFEDPQPKNTGHQEQAEEDSKVANFAARS